MRPEAGGAFKWWPRIGKNVHRSYLLRVSMSVFITGTLLMSPHLAEGLTVGCDAFSTHHLCRWWIKEFDGLVSQDAQWVGVLTQDVEGETSVFVAGSAGGYAAARYALEGGRDIWFSNLDLGIDVPRAMALDTPSNRLVLAGGTCPQSVVCGSSSFHYTVISFNLKDGSVAWIRNETRFDWPVAVQVGLGGMIVVGGWTLDQDLQPDFSLVAYRGGDGAKLWDATYDLPGPSSEFLTDLVIDPAGTRIYAAGFVRDGRGIVAFDAKSGEVQWENTAGEIRTIALEVSPDGAGLYAAGRHSTSAHCVLDGCNPDGFSDFVTEAFDADDGELEWRRYYDGFSSGNAEPSDLAVDPNGTRVFVTGTVDADRRVGPFNLNMDRDRADYGTVAYEASLGIQLWEATFSGPSAGFEGGDGYQVDTAEEIAVSPEGQYVYVTGSSLGLDTGFDFLTVAYDAISGLELAFDRYDGPGHGDDRPRGLETAETGGIVIVAGRAIGARGPTDGDAATVTYRFDTLDSGSGSKLLDSLSR